MIWPLGSLTLICPLALHTRTRNAGVAAKKVEKVRQKRGGSEGQGKAGRARRVQHGDKGPAHFFTPLFTRETPIKFGRGSPHTTPT